jgi:hypothetical protein
MRALPLLIAAFMVVNFSRANADETTDDVRCIMIQTMVMNSQEGNPNAQRQTAGFMLYYIGRIQGRDPKADIEGLIRVEAPKMDANEVHASGTKCLGGMKQLSVWLHAAAANFRLWAKDHPDMAARLSGIQR